MPAPARTRSRLGDDTKAEKYTTHTPGFWDVPAQLLTDIPAQENVPIRFFGSSNWLHLQYPSGIETI